jgi:hypothetical protein
MGNAFLRKGFVSKIVLPSLDVNDATAYAARQDEHHQGSNRLSPASGATAISIIETEGICSFRVGLKIDQNAVSVSCLPETVAAAVVKSARSTAARPRTSWDLPVNRRWRDVQTEIWAAVCTCASWI